MGLFLGWCHKLLCMHVYKDLIRCKSVCDVNPGIDPCPLLARSCDRWWLNFVTFTTYKKSRFCLKRRSAFGTGVLLKRKKYFGVIGTLTIWWIMILHVWHKTNNQHVPHKLIVSSLSWLCGTRVTSRRSGNSGPRKRKTPGYFFFSAVKYFPIFVPKLSVCFCP